MKIKTDILSEDRIEDLIKKFPELELEIGGKRQIFELTLINHSDSPLIGRADNIHDALIDLADQVKKWTHN